MSIPKEPRQLMINIMYLVLTALLALNVSAEIFNAFEMVDKGLISANNSLDASNNAKPQGIKDSAKKKASLQTYADRVDPVRAISAEASSYIDGILDKLIDESGDISGAVDEGDYVMVKDKRELKGKKSYDATTRIMVDGGLGEELKTKMMAYRDSFLAYVDEEDKAAVATELAINIDEESWTKSVNKKKNWSDFTFGHMPLGATVPIFSKFKNDIKSSESAVLNHLAGKVGLTSEVVLDNFRVVSAPKKSYIIKGDKYEADIFLSAAAGSDSKTGISISVNGSKLPTDKDGNAKYTATANSTGKQTYSATAFITNPVTGETDSYKSTFEYEVGERSVAISPTKMNVFYIGVDNPVEISAAGVNSTSIKPTMGGKGGGTIKKNSDGTYNVRVTQPTIKGEFAKVNVSADGMNASKDFRVKRIPDPTPMIGRNKGGSVGSGELKTTKGIFPVLEGFDFEAKCDIVGFTAIFAAKRKDIEVVKNPGWKWGSDVTKLIDKAKPGDRFIFDNIKCKCPGDPAPRDIGNLSLGVK